MKFLLLLFVFCFCLSFFGNSYWIFDLFSHFRLHLFLATLGLSVLALFLQRYSILFPALIFCFVILGFGGPYGSSSKDITQSPEPHKILSCMTFNVWKDNTDLKPTLNYIRSLQPDVIGLIEVDHHLDRALQSLKDIYPYYYSKPEEGRFGLALMSRHPFEVTKTSLYMLNEPVIAVKLTPLTPASAPIHLMLFHPRPPINAAFTKSRNEDFNTIGEWIQNHGHDPIIIMGDFNATCWSPALETLIQTHQLVGTKGLLSGGTWPAELGYFGIRIDHIFTKNFKKLPDISVGPNLGSDHRPVHARLTWP